MIHLSQKLGIPTVGAILSLLVVQATAHANIGAIQCPDGSFVIPPDECPSAAQVPESSTAPTLVIIGVVSVSGLAWKRIQQVKGNRRKED